MLVLARRCDEKIIITVGTEIIEIRILEIIPKKVRLGFTASPNVTIDREEVYEDKIICKEALTKINKHPIVKFNNEK